jgi:hypothetical protein
MVQATGRVQIKTDGRLLRSRAGASLQTGGTIRAPLTTDSADVYFTEDTQPSSVTATLVHVAEDDIVSLRSLRDFTLTFETDTGAGWSIANAFVTEVGELSNGEYTVTFAGPPANRTR